MKAFVQKFLVRNGWAESIAHFQSILVPTVLRVWGGHTVKNRNVRVIVIWGLKTLNRIKQLETECHLDHH